MRIVFFHTLLLALATPALLHAQGFDNPLSSFAVQEMLRGFIMAVIYVGTPAVVVGIVWVGFLFAAAQGNTEALKQAKKMAVLVLVAGTVFLSLWAIVTLVGTTLAGLSSAALLIIIAGGALYAFSISS